MPWPRRWKPVNCESNLDMSRSNTESSSSSCNFKYGLSSELSVYERRGPKNSCWTPMRRPKFQILLQTSTINNFLNKFHLLNHFCPPPSRQPHNFSSSTQLQIEPASS